MGGGGGVVKVLGESGERGEYGSGVGFLFG